jgi:hypothetical protein
VWALYSRKDGTVRIRFSFRAHWLSAVLAGATVLLPAALIFAYPAGAAAACPQCFGFARIDEGLFVQDSMPSEIRQQADDVVRRARERVREFYGDSIGTPSVLVCATNDCYSRMHGGRSRGMALSTFALVLSPRGTTVTIAAHELSHIELHTRIGALRAYEGAIPAWFDEGLAVVASDDARYLKPEGWLDRCLETSDEPLPLTQAAWLRRANDHMYAVAACRVSRWLTANGGQDGLLRLTQRIADGADFADAAR